MRIVVHDHQGKAFRLLQALLELGHEIVAQPPADLLLLDQDSLPYYQRIIDSFPGVPIVVYPHGAMSWACWDAGWEVNDRTIGQLVIGEGAAEAMRTFGYPRPVKAIGWLYGERKPFEPRPLGSVLFAPIHPLNNGAMYPPAKEANAKTFDRLLDTGLPLTVRYLGELEACGLWGAAGVSYIGGSDLIDHAATEAPSVAVGFETFAYCSVARGQPTAMMGQDIPYWTGHGEYQEAEHWNWYANQIRFPLDVGEGDISFLRDTLQEACRSNAEIGHWRERFIGEPMTADCLENALMELMS